LNLHRRVSVEHLTKSRKAFVDKMRRPCSQRRGAGHGEVTNLSVAPGADGIHNFRSVKMSSKHLEIGQSVQV